MRGGCSHRTDGTDCPLCRVQKGNVFIGSEEGQRLRNGNLNSLQMKPPSLNATEYNDASLRAAQSIPRADPGSAGDYGFTLDPEYWKEQ